MDPLQQPFQLKHLTLRNRIMSTSHEPAYTEDGLPRDRYRLYHVEKARGGIGLTMIGGSAVVAPDSPPSFGNLHLYREDIVPWLRRLADECHQHGAAVMCQVTHLGRRTGWNTGDWLPVLWPSLKRESAHRAFPKVMEDFDIERIVRAYAEGAARCQDGGLDGIELEAYGHLLDAFWSPAWNERDDEYGGSLDNRMRFSERVIAAIRERVGSDFVVGIRMVVDEAIDPAMGAGLDEETGMAIACRLAAAGNIDFINVIRGHVDSDEGLSHVIPGMGTPAAPHLEFSGRVRDAVGLPVLHAARINDVATARHAVAAGLLDLVGMTRAHLADPHIGVKIARGEEHRIRPCVGMGYCIDRIYEGGEALCIHNPATGREASMPHSVAASSVAARRVVVVGAGPAGLEAARVCAARGHSVVVFEAQNAPGGQLRVAAGLARRREVAGIIDWRVSELERDGAELRLNQMADVDMVLAESPDVVIIATGGIPNTGFVTAGEDLLTTSWDVLSAQAAVSGDVLMFDDNGAHPGMSCTEFMAEAGARVELVTPERTLAPEIGGTNYPAYFNAFHRNDVVITLNHRLRAVTREGNKLKATLFNEYSHQTRERLVDHVVVEHGTVALDDLYFALKPLSSNRGEVDLDALIAVEPQTIRRDREAAFQLFRIGDAVASRNIHAAIYDALRLCVPL